MKKLTTIFAVFIAITINAQIISKSEYMPNELIIKVKNEFSGTIKKSNTGYNIEIPAIDKLNKKYTFTKIEKVFPFSDINKKGTEDLATIYLIKFHDVVNIPQLVDEYLNTGYIEYAEPNYIDKISGNTITEVTPNDQYFSNQWSLNNTGGTSSLWGTAKAGADIDAKRAWDVTTGNSSIVVSIIDTGAKYTQTELTGRIWTNPGETNNNNKDDDGNGLVDDYYGWDFKNKDKNPDDDNGHGTHVTGIIACKSNNSTGFTGIDWNCKAMIIKAFGVDGTCTHTDLAAGIQYSTDKGARIINMSLGGGDSYTKQNACSYANARKVILVSAAGNVNQEAIDYPAAYSFVIAVGATDPQDRRSVHTEWASSYGSALDVVAPGSWIYGLNLNGTYSTWKGGTSQATPMVSGICALILSINPNFSTTDVTHIITTTAEDQVGRSNEDVAGWDKYHGFGRVNAYFAVTYAQSYTPSSISQNEINNSKNNWAIFPNPANNEVFISLKNIPNYTNSTIRFFNQYGALVKTANPDNNLVNIAINDLDDGIYYVQIISNNIIETKKIIVQK